MKKILTSVLVGAMLMSMGTAGFSAAVNKSEVTQSGGTAESRVTVDIASAKFKATVPTVLPIYVDSENVVTVANNARIANASSGPIEVKNARVENVNGWSVVPFNTNFKKVPVNLKQYGMIINNSEVATTGSFSIAGFDIIPGDETIPVTYNANVAIQSDPLKDYNIGKVVFTVGWATPMKYYSDMATFAADIANGTTANGSDSATGDAEIAMSVTNGLIRVKLVKDVQDAPAMNLANSSYALDLDLNGHTLNMNGKTWTVPSNTQMYNGTVIADLRGACRRAVSAGTSSAHVASFTAEDLNFVATTDGSCSGTTQVLYVQAENASLNDISIDITTEANNNATSSNIVSLWLGANSGTFENVDVHASGGLIKMGNGGESTFVGVATTANSTLNFINYTCKLDNAPTDNIFGILTNGACVVNVDECDIDLPTAPKKTCGAQSQYGATINFTDHSGTIKITVADSANHTDDIGVSSLDNSFLTVTASDASRAIITGGSAGVIAMGRAAMTNATIIGNEWGISSTREDVSFTNCIISAEHTGAIVGKVITGGTPFTATFNNCTITAAQSDGAGLRCQEDSHTIATNCNITGKANGVTATKNTQLDIIGGTIVSNGDIASNYSVSAIFFGDTATGTVQGATVNGNRYGVYATNDANATLDNCTVIGVTAGTVSSGSASLTVTNSNVTGADAGQLTTVNGNVVANNSNLTATNGNAVTLLDSTTATINGGSMTGSAMGIYGSKNSHFDVTGAEINANGTAVWADGKSIGTVKNTNAISQTAYGLALGDGVDGGNPACTVENSLLKGVTAYGITNSGTLTLNPGTVLQYTGNTESYVAPGGTVIDNR